MNASSLLQVALVGLCVAGTVRGGSVPAAQAAVETAIAVETSLLAEDTAAYLDARQHEIASRKAADEIVALLDAAFASSEGTSIADIARLDREAETAGLEAERWASLSTRLRGFLIERRRRLSELEGKRVPATREDQAPSDPVSGRWAVRILPSGQTAEFRLELDVSLVAGSYRTETGAFGSLRGTFVGEVLTLERVDSKKGADLIFEGRVDPTRGEVRGTWRSTLLSSGDPAAGNWVAFRQAATPTGGVN